MSDKFGETGLYRYTWKATFPSLVDRTIARLCCTGKSWVHSNALPGVCTLGVFFYRRRKVVFFSKWAGSRPSTGNFDIRQP